LPDEERIAVEIGFREDFVLCVERDVFEVAGMLLFDQLSPGWAVIGA
jgi:hypothetical protein